MIIRIPTLSSPTRTARPTGRSSRPTSSARGSTPPAPGVRTDRSRNESSFTGPMDLSPSSRAVAVASTDLSNSAIAVDVATTAASRSCSGSSGAVPAGRGGVGVCPSAESVSSGVRVSRDVSSVAVPSVAFSVAVRGSWVEVAPVCSVGVDEGEPSESRVGVIELVGLDVDSADSVHVGVAVGSFVEALVAVGEAVRVGVAVGNGLGVGEAGGALTVSEPLLVDTSTPDPSGEVAAALLSCSGMVPADAVGEISNATLTIVPSGIAVWFKPKTMTRTVPEDGEKLDMDLPALEAAPPAVTSIKLRREESNDKSKFTPETSVPESDLRVTGILMPLSPGSPDALPAES